MSPYSEGLISHVTVFYNYRSPQVPYSCRDWYQLQRDSTVLITTYPGHRDLSPPRWTLTTELERAH